ncbi:MAG TPA: hypothetical protein VFP80_02695 [Thermoanaerobaculia bacterium]|nr:hypothetical protein [Thermoanaerobaculia bacterium]
MYFEYNASALGAGGVVEYGPVAYTIPSMASIALAPTGGEGRSVVSNYYSQELAFSHAETRVSGRPGVTPKGEPSFTTWTYVQLKDVNIFDRVKIGEMGSTVTSTRGFEEDDDHPFEFTIWYRDVTVDGKQVQPKIDLRLTGPARYADLANTLNAPKTAAAGGSAVSASMAKFLKGKKPVQCSMVEHIEGLSPRPQRVVPVPGLGVVHFAELVLKPGRRRLNLLRFAFGPRAQLEGPFTEGLDGGVTGGSMTLGSGEGNGTPIGP